MEEDPKDHDFDQRQDGPLQQSTRPSVHIATDLPHRRDESALEKQESSKSVPTMPSSATPTSKPGRRSSQTPRADEGVPRRSTQMSRASRRTSRDFDRRTDGPYGRPSVTMTRRRSSAGFDNVPMTPVTPPRRAETEPTTTGEAKEEEEAEPTEQGLESQDTSTSQSIYHGFEPEPPPLNYTLWTRKLSIFVFWSFILIDSIAMPIVLYFCLWYDTDLSPNTVFSIVTAALGGVSILEYVLRFRRLWRKGSTCRVIGARRSYLDWFHWNFSLAWVVIMVELIVGTIPTNPPIRLLSMPLASMLYAFGTELLIVDILRYFQVPAPCRISSIPKGAQLRPCIYSIIEDVCAVDGSGGTEFRENLNRRYEASHTFRAMLRRLGVYWAIGAESAAVVTTILVFTVGKDAAYVIGWSLPFVWAGIWTAGTIMYVRKKLKDEKKAWAEEVAAKAGLVGHYGV